MNNNIKFITILFQVLLSSGARLPGELWEVSGSCLCFLNVSLSSSYNTAHRNMPGRDKEIWGLSSQQIQFVLLVHPVLAPEKFHTFCITLCSHTVCFLWTFASETLPHLLPLFCGFCMSYISLQKKMKSGCLILKPTCTLDSRSQMALASCFWSQPQRKSCSQMPLPWIKLEQRYPW